MINFRQFDKIKHVVDGSIEKYSAWFVAIIFQKDEVDPGEAFNPIARGFKIHEQEIHI